MTHIATARGPRGKGLRGRKAKALKASLGTRRATAPAAPDQQAGTR